MTEWTQHPIIAYRYSILLHNFRTNNYNCISLFLYSIYRSTDRMLWFLEPAATILGGQQDLFVDKGSTINLTCTIQFGPEPPGYIFWYHDHKVSVAFFLILYLQFMGGLFFFDCHSFSFCHSFIWFNVYSTQSTRPTLSCWRNNKNNITTLIVLLSFRFSTVHFIHYTVYTVQCTSLSCMMW